MILLTADTPEYAALEHLKTLNPDRAMKKIKGWLFGTNVPRRNIAATVLKRGGADPTYLLLRKAMNPKLDDERRSRLIDSAEQLGVPIQINHLWEVNSLMTPLSPQMEIRMMCAIKKCQPREEVASVR